MDFVRTSTPTTNKVLNYFIEHHLTTLIEFQDRRSLFLTTIVAHVLYKSGSFSLSIVARVLYMSDFKCMVLNVLAVQIIGN